MARILNRPMFKKGGSTNEGIMHGLVNRRGYAEGPTEAEIYAKQYEDMLSKIQPSRPKFPMGQVGLNLISGQYAGEGLLPNVARSAMDPYGKWKERKAAHADLDYQKRMTATTMGIKRAESEALLRAKNDPNRALRNVYLTQAIEDGYDAPEAQRIADYQITTKTELQNKVGRERIGGLIEFDLNDEKQKKKQLPKLKKDIGKYFYDPYDGKIKLLTEQNGVLGFVEFNSVADITFGDLPAGVSTKTSTPYADAQAAIEQEKSEGILTDEDIIAQRFP